MRCTEAMFIPRSTCRNLHSIGVSRSPGSYQHPISHPIITLSAIVAKCPWHETSVVVVSLVMGVRLISLLFFFNPYLRREALPKMRSISPRSRREKLAQRFLLSKSRIGKLLARSPTRHLHSPSLTSQISHATWSPLIVVHCHEDIDCHEGD